MNKPDSLLLKLQLINDGLAGNMQHGSARFRRILDITGKLWDCSYLTYSRSRSGKHQPNQFLTWGTPFPELIIQVTSFQNELDQEGNQSVVQRKFKLPCDGGECTYTCIGAKILHNRKYFGSIVLTKRDDCTFTDEDIALLQILLNALGFEEQHLLHQAAVNTYTERVETLFETLPIMMFLVDEALNIFSINKQACEELGYSESELLGQPMLKLFAPALHPVVRMQAKTCFDNPGNTYTWEIEKLKKNKESIFVKEKAQLFSMDEELKLLLVLCDDITERKEYNDRISKINIDLENRVRERTAQLQYVNTELEYEIQARKVIEQTLTAKTNLLDEATKLAKLGSFEYYAAEKKLVTSTVFRRILGLPQHTKLPKIESMLALFPPSDLKAIRTGASGIKSIHDSFDSTVSLHRKDGLKLQIALRLRAMEKDGEIIGLFGTIQDITEQKQAEQQFSIMANAISSLTDTVVVTDTDEIITYVNKTFSQVYGFDEQELIGKSINFIRSQNNPAGLLTEIRQMTLLNGWQGELLNIHKDGTEFPVSLATSKVTDADGKIIALIGVARDITTEKAAQEALIKSEEKFRSLFESVHDIFFIIERDGTIREISPSVSHYTDKSREEIIGMNIRDGFLYDAREIFRLTKLLMVNKEIFDYEVKLRGINGLLLYTSFNARAKFDTNGNLTRIEGTFRDITDRKAAENALRKQVKIEEFLAAISSKFINISLENINKTITESIETLGQFTNSGFVMVSFVQNLKSLQPNFFWSKKAPHPNEKLTIQFPGQEIHDFFQNMKDPQPTLLRYSKKYHGSAQPMQELLRSTGLHAMFLLPMNIRSGYHGYIGFMYSGTSKKWMSGDVSYLSFIAEIFSQLFERKKMEDELIEAKKLAEESSRTKEQFLAHMSHELKTPLNAIIGSTYLLERSNQDKKQSEYVDSIRISADLLLSLVNDILDYSKLKAGKVEIVNVNFALSTIIDMVNKIAKIQAEHKLLTIHSEIDPNIPEVIYGDPERLAQILINLITNAVKYTDKGSIVLQVSLESSDAHTMKLQFAIKDTGIGIAKHNQKIIFDDFSRSRSPESKMRDGTGLGLAICKNLVNLMGGTISLESKVGIGSVFYVSLPFKRATVKSIEKNYEQYNYFSGSLKDVKILIVEDNEFNRLIVRELMQDWKADYRIAVDGESAYEIMQQEDFSIVLLDLGLPFMSGYDLARLIRSSLPGNKKDVPIIALTAANTKTEHQKAVACGINDYLTKPFSAKQLFEKLTTLALQNTASLKKDYSSADQAVPLKAPKHFRPKQLMDENILTSSFLIEIISQFIKNAPVELRKMHDAAKKNQHQTVYAAAHKAKSMYMYLKLHKASALLKKIEKAAQNDTSGEKLIALIDRLSTMTGLIIIEMNNSLHKLRNN